MSLRELKDVIDSRIKQKNAEIYSLAGMIRTAIVTAFNKKERFPDPPHVKAEGDWQKSKAYMEAVRLAQGGVKKK